MEPLHRTETDLVFTANWSPYWLLLFVPLVLAIGYWLYRRQLTTLTRGRAAGLLVLRGILLAGLVILAFRPDLVFREILTFGGRIVLLVDDSDSMGSRDPGYSDSEALHIARRLNPDEQIGDDVWYDLASQLRGVAQQLRRFQQESAELSRESETFWEAAEEAGQAIGGRYDEVSESLGNLQGRDELDAARWQTLVSEVTALRRDTQQFFGGTETPGARAYRAYYDRLQALRGDFLQLQAATDRRAIADGAPQLADTAEQIRGRSRLDLVQALIATRQAAWAEEHPTQHLRRVALISGDAAGVPADEPLQAAGGPSDISGRVLALANAEHDFPLSAVVLFSEGRDAGMVPSEVVTEILSRKQVPLFAASAGSLVEPTDVAVLDLRAPPFATKGRELRVRVQLKTQLPEPRERAVSIVRDGKTLVSETVRLGERATRAVELSFAPEKVGRGRFTVQVGSSEDEVIPARNNSRDFVMEVREDRVRVLFLDWQPRWETRFALNILQRLDYIELNAIIGLAQDEATIERGVGMGKWPQDAETMAGYDLVVIGSLPPGTLTEGEWQQVANLVLEKGKTLCLLGGKHAPLPSEALAADLLPVTGNAPPVVSVDGLDQLRLSSAGRQHPLTRAMADHVPSAGATATEALAPRSIPLLQVEGEQLPLVSFRYAGKGRTVLLADGELWRHLNPTALAAHAGVYLKLVTWAIAGDSSRLEPEAEDVELLQEQPTVQTGQSLQVWARNASGGETVVARIGEEEVATAELAPAFPGSSLHRAVFEQLPVGDVAFSVGDVAARQLMPITSGSRELARLARDPEYLADLAEGSGGIVADFANADRLLSRAVPRERVQKQERTWQLWNSAWVLGFLVLVLTVEWVWRKFEGLV